MYGVVSQNETLSALDTGRDTDDQKIKVLNSRRDAIRAAFHKDFNDY